MFRKRWSLFLLVLVTVTLPLAARGNPAVYWVEFIDKGCHETLHGEVLRDTAFAHGLTDAALERRIVEGLAGDTLVTVDDLPPDPGYLHAVEAAGADVRQVSRWFNLASVEAEQEAVSRILELPFVLSVTPMGYLKPTHSEYEIVATFDGNPIAGPDLDAGGTYGPSYNQALQVNAVEAHRLGYTGRGVLMTVLDSGFTLDHEAFERIDVVAVWDVTNNDDAVHQEQEDAPKQTAHGTLCLSTIAGYRPGTLIGTAYGASFLLVKSEHIPTETIQEEDDYVAGLEWAERLGARVSSSSLGYTDWYNDAMRDGEIPLTSRALRRASELGVLCVTSSGNEGPQPRTLGSPADQYGGLTIGAVDSLGIIARFSSRGPTSDGRTKPDLVGRGVRCVAVKPLTNNTYTVANGTSLSTPVVAGVAALVRGAHPDWSAKKAIRALKSTASRAERPDNVYGWGIPDAVTAIRYPELRMVFEGASGEAVAGVVVRLAGPNGSSVAESDERGIVSLPNLDEGIWEWSLDPPDGQRLENSQANGSVEIRDGASYRFTLEMELQD